VEKTQIKTTELGTGLELMDEDIDELEGRDS
jgi:hypothetical protein